MRHLKAGIKLSRTASHRNALFRNMVTSLFKYDRIRTTDVKAKELRRWADNLITLAKQGDLHSRRQALAVIREKDVVHKLFEKANERFGNINGGYTRIIKFGRRPGDSAPISIVELVTLDKDKKKIDRSEKSIKQRKDVKPAAPTLTTEDRFEPVVKKEAIEVKDNTKEREPQSVEQIDE